MSAAKRRVGRSGPSTQTAATQNTAGNTYPDDWCLGIGATTAGTTVDGFNQNGNGWDAPENDVTWPNPAFDLPAHVSVWLR